MSGNLAPVNSIRSIRCGNQAERSRHTQVEFTCVFGTWRGIWRPQGSLLHFQQESTGFDIINPLTNEAAKLVPRDYRHQKQLFFHRETKLRHRQVQFDGG
jgi:hypothetical protein